MEICKWIVLILHNTKASNQSIDDNNTPRCESSRSLHASHLSNHITYAIDRHHD
jgi:hypothetical protein